MWPITQYLMDTLGVRDQAAAARVVVDRLDAGNRNKAFRRVHALLDEGRFDAKLARRLEAAFPEHAGGLHAALAATRAEREAARLTRESQRLARAAEAFRPHLWLVTERERPTQITIVGLAGGVDRWKKLWLEASIGEEPWPVQQRLVRAAVREHRHSGPSRARVTFFGGLLGYWYRPRPESSFWVSVDGIVHRRDHGPFREPVARVRGAPSLVG